MNLQRNILHCYLDKSNNVGVPSLAVSVRLPKHSRRMENADDETRPQSMLPQWGKFPATLVIASRDFFTYVRE